ncbi:methylenetetrahydrofolate reductase [Natranaerobius trueperi]|nr:methylenetetrahydrofolate reductase [Natranaerobius trueperi]
MKISNIYSKTNRPVLSFEIFPPKRKKNQTRKDFDTLLNTVDKLTTLNPDFISVTYGAGGTDSEGSFKVSKYIKDKGVVALPHFTSIGYPSQEINSYLEDLGQDGFANILALRGDLPKEPSKADMVWKDFLHATDLIKIIKKEFPRFCIGGAAYPQGHQESNYDGKDIEVMKLKEEMGVEFFLTQLFFDNDKYLRFVETVKNHGVTAPIGAGVMPLMSPKFVDKILKLSGATLHKELHQTLDKYRDDEEEFLKRTIDFCIRQVNDLIERGVDGIHLYTMNKYHPVKKIINNLDIKTAVNT